MVKPPKCKKNSPNPKKRKQEYKKRTDENQTKGLQNVQYLTGPKQK